MAIKIYNENRLTRQPFFKALMEYLATHDDVTLRQIHRDFSDVKNLDRSLENYISAGLIVRADKRYTLGFTVFGDDDFNLSALTESEAVQNQFTAPFFVRADSLLAQKLDASLSIQTLSNSTNAVKLNFVSRYDRTTDTLTNYFYKVAEQLPLSALENEIYQIMGDVDPEYALKYMTTFLLKFMSKDVVKTRPDIFVKVLEKYGIVEAVSEREYKCLLKFEQREIPAVSFDNAHDFIAAQLQQTQKIEDFISLDDN